MKTRMRFKRLKDEDMKNPFWRLVSRIRIWKFSIKTMINPKIMYVTYVNETGQKIFCIIIVKSGKPIWSRHMVVEKVLDDEGVPNTKFDKVFEKWN